MTAGILTYRLCDGEFDCDHCPLDAALQGRGTTRRESSRAIRPAAWAFPDDRRYTRSHAWVKSVGAGEVRFGLDAFAARLLDRLTAVTLPPAPSRVTSGRPACWLLDEDELIPLATPITGTVLRANTRLPTDPALIISEPYDDGWLLDLTSDGSLEHMHGLNGAEEQRARSLKHLEDMQCYLSGSDESTALGPTLEDGGEPVIDARRVLGTVAYHRLIRSFLN
jgi:glycine cleavage system H protein